MRFLCAALGAAFLANAAFAEELKAGKDWRNCSKDEQCVMIDGLCGKTSVNWQVKDKAIAFYNKERPHTECPTKFWAAKEKVVRCHLGGCDTRPKQASDEPSATH